MHPTNLENDGTPPKPAGVIRKAVALLALAGIIAYIVRALPLAGTNLSLLLAKYGWRFLLQPQFLFCIAGFAFELFLAYVLLWGGILAQTAPTEEETDIANIYIFILLTLVAIIGEIVTGLTFSAGGPPGWVIAFLVILASLIGIWATFAWIWTPWWILARRNICFVFIPQFRSATFDLWLTSIQCLAWTTQQWQLCAQYWLNFMQVCAQWVSTTTQECVQWATVTLPGWLSWIVDIGCAVFAAVVATVCALWFIVAEVICILWLIILVLICLVWMVIVTLILIVVLIFLGLLIFAFFCY